MRRWLAGLIALASCVRSEAVTCSDGRICPTDNVCDEVNRACVYPDQLTSCLGLADGTPCDINHVAGGICKNEICIEARCGDGLVAGTETCDGAEDIPDVGTCVDFAFDYGALGCSAQCSDGLAGCRRLGWQFRSLSGEGQVSGVWEDAGDLWVATQRGILHRRAGTWQPAVYDTIWWRAIWAGGGRAFAAGSNGAVAQLDGTTWSLAQVSAQTLGGIWGRSATDVYAVGGRAGEGEAWHFDGARWTPHQLPANTPQLAAVWGDATTVYAVGHSGTIVALAGNTWQTMPSPVTSRLTAVWGTSANEVFVTGSPDASTSMMEAVVLRYDGTDWEQMKIPPGTAELTAISGRSSTEIYAVGRRGGSNILYWDGQSWAPMVSDVRDAALALFAVHAGESTIYAARRPSIFLEYQRAGWVESIAAPGGIRALWGTGSDYLVAVGDGLALREYRGVWADVDYPPCWGPTGFVFDVWGSSRDDVWIVGPYGKMLHRTAQGFTCVDAPTPKWLASVWGSGPDDVFAVGASADGAEPHLVHWDGTAWADWSDRVQPLVAALNGVWGAGPDDVYAIGGTKVLHYDGATWRDAGLVTDVTLSAIWGASASDVFVVGAQGAIFHFDGTAWTRMVVPVGLAIPTDGRWSDIHGTAADDVYVVGGRTLLHYDGTSWAPIARMRASSADAVWTAPNDVVLAGDGGIDPRLIGRLR